MEASPITEAAVPQEQQNKEGKFELSRHFQDFSSVLSELCSNYSKEVDNLEEELNLLNEDMHKHEEEAMEHGRIISQQIDEVNNKIKSFLSKLPIHFR